MGVLLAYPHCHKCFVHVGDYTDTVKLLHAFYIMQQIYKEINKLRKSTSKDIEKHFIMTITDKYSLLFPAIATKENETLASFEVFIYCGSTYWNNHRQSHISIFNFTHCYQWEFPYAYNFAS